MESALLQFYTEVKNIIIFYIYDAHLHATSLYNLHMRIKFIFRQNYKILFIASTNYVFNSLLCYCNSGSLLAVNCMVYQPTTGISVRNYIDIMMVLMMKIVVIITIGDHGCDDIRI